MTNATVTSLARYRIRRATRVANATHLVAGPPAGFKQTPVTSGLSLLPQSGRSTPPLVSAGQRGDLPDLIA